MKRKLLAIILSVGVVSLLVGCEAQSSKVSYNLSQEADNFNVVRQLTVINSIQGDTLFQMTGKLSITADTSDNQLEVVVEDDKGAYQKHIIGLSDNVSYIVEQMDVKDVSNYKYTLNYNPKMWIPVEFENID